MKLFRKINSGFTLIELSIVLIVIGLIVGGILTGRDLIDAAAQRAQIAQIEKYNTAVHTFQTKYGGYLPGDIPDPQASSFGFIARGSFAGEGDGNGIFEGNCNNVAAGNLGWSMGSGETVVFWEDLGTANLIDTQPSGASSTISVNVTTVSGLSQWFPTAKMGQGYFVYVYSLNGINYFSFSPGTQISGCGYYGQANAAGLTVQQAYNIDSKIDDGLPEAGNVTACYINANVGTNRPIWAEGNTNGGSLCTPAAPATAYSAIRCFDNGGVASSTQKYELQNANIQNCALSFKFQ